MDPILISVAAAAAGKASEAVVKAGAVAVRRAAEVVRRRFAGKPELAAAEQGRIPVEDFAEAVERVCLEDNDFREALSTAIGREIRIVKFHNEIRGDVKNIIQADRIENLRLD